MEAPRLKISRLPPMAARTIHAASAWARDLLASVVERAKDLVRPNECDVCRKIKTACGPRWDYYSENLGELDEILDSECGIHKPLVRHFAQQRGLDGPRNGALLGITRNPPSTSFGIHGYVAVGASESFL